MRAPLPLSGSISFYLSLTLVLASVSGCARSTYRRQADREAYRLIDQKAEQMGASTVGWQLDRGEDSRLFDPQNPDRPPMPQDDPASHELMRTGPRTADGASAEPHTQWRQALPSSKGGTVVLNMRDAVEVAARNSREFQSAREELYLSALDLSEERYEFRPRLGLGSTGSRNETGRLHNADRRGAGLGTDGSLSLLTGWGTQLLANFVNTVIWDFDQPKLRTATTLLNFSIIQPLMRFGGRARVLEPLTQAERHLLANVRRMEQYQQGFYLGVVAGRDATNGPIRSSNANTNAPALLAGNPSGVAGVPTASGYLGLLEEQQRIRNLESNVAGLRSSLEQLEAAFDAGRASSLLQVLQARQALQTAQSSLLTARAAYATRVDSFKTEIGLPPSAPVVVRDALLDRFTVFDPATTALQNQVNDVASLLHDRQRMSTIEALRPIVAEMRKLQPAFTARFSAARRDIVAFGDALPERKRQFESLSQREEVRALGLDSTRFDPKSLQAKAVESDQLIAGLQKNVEGAFAELAAIEADLSSLDFATARARTSVVASSLSGYVLELSLDHAASRIEAITLPPSDLEERHALDIAKANRLDWMNARAEFVDAWRKIDYEANPLMSGLDLGLSGDIASTKPSGSHFDARASRLRGELRIDTPLDRLRERNNYREALVGYQRARRDYMLFEDRVSQSLRNTLRLMELGQLNFELRRSAVQSALAQVDLARLRLEEPPRPGQTAQIGATAARDLVSALSDLLAAQNGFLSLWVGYEVLRMELDYELGLMRLDPAGHWIEPGPFTKDRVERRLTQQSRKAAQFAANTSSKAEATKPKTVIR